LLYDGKCKLKHQGDTNLKIAAITEDTVGAAQALVNRVFPLQSPAESSFYWTHTHRHSYGGKLVMWLSGIAEFTALWVAIDDHNQVIGTTGLYRYRKDANEAVWLAWFCVAPEARGAGIGGRLLDFTIEQARATGAMYLRLYTSDVPNEAAAQHLYESRGLQIYRTQNRLFYRHIERELHLQTGTG
jgi:GNAT superfamily N-acetyltransferase